MNGAVTSKQVVAHAYFSLLCVLALSFLLPHYGGVILAAGCAGVLTAYIAVEPEHFRGRNRTLSLAKWLIVGMWAMAAMVAVMTLTGAVSG